MFFLPWLDNSPVRSIRYRQACKFMYGAVRGQTSPSPGLPGCAAAMKPIGERVSQVGALLFYFGFHADALGGTPG